MPWSKQRHKVSAIPVQSVLRSSLLWANLIPFHKELAPSQEQEQKSVGVFFWRRKNPTKDTLPHPQQTQNKMGSGLIIFRIAWLSTAQSLWWVNTDPWEMRQEGLLRDWKAEPWFAISTFLHPALSHGQHRGGGTSHPQYGCSFSTQSLCVQLCACQSHAGNVTQAKAVSPSQTPLAEPGKHLFSSQHIYTHRSLLLRQERLPIGVN